MIGKISVYLYGTEKQHMEGRPRDTQRHTATGRQEERKPPQLVVFVTAALGNDTPFKFMAAAVQETKQISALSVYVSPSLEISGLPFTLQTQFSGKSKRSH